MSDVERPTPRLPQPTPARTSPAGAVPPPPARSMADIARIFLDGARPVNGSAPQRTPPGAVPVGVTHPVPVMNTPQGSDTVMLALCSPDAGAWRMLSCAATGLAEAQSTTVALLGIHNNTLLLDLFGSESPDDLPFAIPSHGAIDMQIARAIFTLRPSVGVWLIAAPDPQASAFPAVASVAREWLLACPTDNAGLVAAYQHLKRAWVIAPLPADAPVPSVMLVTDDYAHAAVVHKRLRTATHEFLNTDLRLAGVGSRQPSMPRRLMTLPTAGAHDTIWAAILDELCPLTEEEDVAATPARPEPEAAAKPGPQSMSETKTPVLRPSGAVHSDASGDIETALEKLESSADDLARSSAAATHAMLDHLAQVLDPEEAAALAAGFDDSAVEDDFAASENFVVEDPVRVAEPPTPVVAKAPVFVPPPVKSMAVQTPELPPHGTVTLRAFDLLDAPAKNRSAQWDAVERSIRDLVPHSVLLEARPPMSWASESCIAIDPDGRLHVWTLYKDGASWFALREWASEHRNLLALTRRDLVLSKELDVAVHIVLPLEEGLAAEASDPMPSIVHTILRTPARNIHLYRLRVVQWNARRGMVVVPIA